MALTPAQIQTLKAAILAETNATFVEFRTAGATGAMAEWYNVAINPVQKAWITNQPPQDSDDAPDYSTFDSISAGKRESWGFFLEYPNFGWQTISLTFSPSGTSPVAKGAT
jgi:hypothetical protein